MTRTNERFSSGKFGAKIYRPRAVLPEPIGNLLCYGWLKHQRKERSPNA
jgi:hypothetical protein